MFDLLYFSCEQVFMHKDPQFNTKLHNEST